jgi:phosphatidylglycerol lysyltransferase
MNRRSSLVALAALATLGSGVLNLVYAATPSSARRVEQLATIFPMAVLHVSRLATLIIGVALVVSAANVMRRKRRAYYTVLGLAGIAAALHLSRGLDYEGALLAILLMALLVLMRGFFTVRSGTPTFRWAAVLFATALAAALVYGISGFWYLDPREFGMDFGLPQAARETVRFLLLVGDPAVVPHTRHARVFLDSLQVATAVAVAYGLVAMFGPIVYR